MGQTSSRIFRKSAASAYLQLSSARHTITPFPHGIYIRICRSGVTTHHFAYYTLNNNTALLKGQGLPESYDEAWRGRSGANLLRGCYGGCAVEQRLSAVFEEKHQGLHHRIFLFSIPPAANVTGKCDEARPSCSQCRRGRRKCPGYDRAMKFVDEGLRLRHSTQDVGIHTQLREPVTVLDLPLPKPAAPTSISRYVPSQRAGCSSHPVDEPHLQRKWNTSLYQQPSSKLERDQLLSSFVSTMFPLGVASVQSSFLGSWLWHVPPRLGSSDALDHAALSLALAYFGRVSSNRRAIQNAQLCYSFALKALAVAIADQRQQFSSEVLCATMLLGYYEVSLTFPSKS
jgi:hypothetical protein